MPTFSSRGRRGWNLRVEVLLDADIFQPRRPRVRRRGHDAAIDLRASGGRQQHERQNARGGNRIALLIFHFFTSSCRSYSSIARYQTDRGPSHKSIRSEDSTTSDKMHAAEIELRFLSFISSLLPAVLIPVLLVTKLIEGHLTNPSPSRTSRAKARILRPVSGSAGSRALPNPLRPKPIYGMAYCLGLRGAFAGSILDTHRQASLH